MRIRVLVLASLAACSDTPPSGEPSALLDSRYPTGSSQLIASHDYRAVYAAHPEAGSVARFDLATRLFTELQLEGEPTRLARAGDTLFVTLKARREIAVLRDTGAELVELERLGTGNEPYGAVVSEDGTRLYVAQALAGRVTEIDVATRTALRHFAVADQPRWLALHPGGRSLYVGSAMRGTLSLIDLANDEVEAIALPEVVTRRFDRALEEEVVVPFARRITGDLAISADGRDLYVPALYVDNVTSVGTSNSPAGFPGDMMPSEPFPGGGGGYASANPTEHRFNPAVVELPLDSDGLPRPDVASVLNARIQGDFFTTFGPTSYLASVTVAPGGDILYGTLEGAGTVIAIERKRVLLASPEHVQQTEQRPLFQPRRSLGVSVGSGPRAIAFTSESRSTVLNALQQSASFFDAASVVRSLEQAGHGMPVIVAAEDATPVSRLLPTPEVMLGRQLFYAAMDHRMAQPGAGVSCATCHYEGRNDGLSWPLENGPRQTPLLAGRVSERQPVTWTETVPTVADEVMLTSQGRMGGFGLDPSAALLVARYLDTVAAPDTPNKGSADPQVARGEELFNSNSVGCGECHNGVAYTDHRIHELYGLNVRTRSLTGVAASAPYLHDGSAATLSELLGSLRGMGTVSHLSAADRAALEAFLLSL